MRKERDKRNVERNIRRENKDKKIRKKQKEIRVF